MHAFWFALISYSFSLMCALPYSTLQTVQLVKQAEASAHADATVQVQAPAPAGAAQALELKDGDRIVWLGGTLVEREQRFGHWESALITENKGKSITFRNLGWSGDTVYGDSRAGFENAAKGFERVVKLTLELKPTIIFMSYGSNECFDGDAGLEKFEKGYIKLLDALKPANAKFVLFTPIPFESGAAAERNIDLKKYSQVIKKIAQKNSMQLADVGDLIGKRFEGKHEAYTEFGIHFHDQGYLKTKRDFLLSLGYQPSESLPEVDQLTQSVVAKNELFFHRWRPQNETYLFGFRKHEQGKNAKEIAEFDPFIEKAEKEIQTKLK
jgi:lysophospholipase L1-like esterase